MPCCQRHCLHNFAQLTLLVCLFSMISCTPLTFANVNIHEVALTDIGDYQYSWSPNGKFILLSWPENNLLSYGRPVDGPIGWVDMSSGTIKYLPRWGYAPLWSPNSSAILYRSGNHHVGNYQLHLFNLSTGQEATLPSMPGNPVAWLQAGLYYEAADGLWRVILNWPEVMADSETKPVWGKRQHVLTYDADDPSYRDINVAPDGRSVAILKSPQNRSTTSLELEIVSLDGAYNTIVENAIDLLGICCTWSPDGSQLAFASFSPEYGLYSIDVRGGQRRQIIATAEIGDGRILSLDFSPDGQRIAFEFSPMGKNPFDDTMIYVTDIGGAQSTRLLSESLDAHNFIRWSPNGRYISFKRNIRHSPVWIADLSALEQTDFTTVSVKFPPPSRVEVVNEPQENIGGMTVAYTNDCPSRVSIIPTAMRFDQQLEFLTVPLADDSSELNGERWHILSALPLRQIANMKINGSASFGLLKMNDSSLAYYTVVYGDKYRFSPAILSLEAAIIFDNNPATIHTVVVEIESKEDLVCSPPQVVMLGDVKALLFEQQAGPKSIIPVRNSLVWIENNSWWSLSALAPESGGQYTANDLVNIARNQLQEYNSQIGQWKPATIK